MRLGFPTLDFNSWWHTGFSTQKFASEDYLKTPTRLNGFAIVILNFEAELGGTNFDL